MIHEHGDIVMVRVTEDAQDFKLNISSEDEWYVLEYLTQNLDEESGFYGEWGEADVELPPGSYTIVGLSSKLSEDEWGDIIPEITADGTQFYYPDFGGRQTMMAVDLKRTATESGLSLLKSKGMKWETTLILKKLK